MMFAGSGGVCYVLITGGWGETLVLAAELFPTLPDRETGSCRHKLKKLLQCENTCLSSQNLYLIKHYFLILWSQDHLL